jgi:hypothetical protein
MKTTKLYLQNSTYRWNCWKCGLPNYFTTSPQGVHSLEGKRIVGTEYFEKGLVLTCERKHMGIPCCQARRKVFIQRAIFDYIPKKLCDKLNKKHTERLHKEDRERQKNHESALREKIIKQLKEERKARKRQKKLKKKGKKSGKQKNFLD